jgi:hypothetical protein
VNAFSRDETSTPNGLPAHRGESGRRDRCAAFAALIDFCRRRSFLIIALSATYDL